MGLAKQSHMYLIREGSSNCALKDKISIIDTAAAGRSPAPALHYMCLHGEVTLLDHPTQPFCSRK